MLEELGHILKIQEIDMKMMRLVRVKKERQRELRQIEELKKELNVQVLEKQAEIESLGKSIVIFEGKIQEVGTKIKKFESQQASVKKADEFNALTQEMTQAEREKIALEQKVSDLVDKRVAEEELLTRICDSLKSSEASSIAIENEIRSSIQIINEEGSGLKKERDLLIQEADAEVLQIYDRLLRNKRDRVIVPIDNRTCSGCHIMLTPQHENLVRKGEKLIFCEHCSRIHYWQERESAEDMAGAPKRRRRKAVVAT